MSETLPLVSFRIGDKEFGVDVLKVQEINRTSKIATRPNSPTFADGVVNLRGKIIPIIDLRLNLNATKNNFDKNTRIIVIELKGKTVGFIVDEISEVVRIPRNLKEAPPEIIAEIDSDYMDKLLMLLALNDL